jgi:hypothetical protein
MNVIDLKEWDVSYGDLVSWANETNADIYAIIHHGGNGASAMYGFEHDEDLLAFKLKFSYEKSNN